VPRQTGLFGGDLGALAGRLVPAAKPVKIEQVAATIPGDDVKRVRITYGPFKLRGAGSKKKEGNFFSLDPAGEGYGYMATDFPTNITVLQARMSIALPDGQVIGNGNGVYNHHAFFYDISKPMRFDVQCEGTSRGMPTINAIMGSSADASQVKLNMTQRPLTANFIDKDHKILLSGDLVNYNNETKEVYQIADLQYVDGKAPGHLSTSANLISATACSGGRTNGMVIVDGLMIRPPKDKKQFTLKGGALVVLDDSKIMVLRGHMHGKNS
jgi:hypothetical protein